MEKIASTFKLIFPVLMSSPAWAQGIYLLTLFFVVLSLVIFVYFYIHPLILEKEPYPEFSKEFREVIAAERFDNTGNLLHVVFGSIAKIKHTTVVLPVGEEIDFNQRGRGSVLAAFSTHTISGSPFYEKIEELYPKNERPRGRGLGFCKYIPFKDESHELNGAIFVVTTRNLSDEGTDYGLYQDTPVEGIDSVLDRVMQETREKNINSLAIPLLGTGYANIALTNNNIELKTILNRIVALITIQKFTEALQDKSSSLKRAVVVIYSSNQNREQENEIWKDIVKFSSKDKKEQLELIGQEIERFNQLQDTQT